MTVRQLRARLDRLERSVGETKLQERRLAFEFPIDPELAKTMLDDWECLCGLDTVERFRKRLRTGNWDDDTPEEIALRERIAQNAKTINCPPSYGLKEFLDDEQTLFAIGGTKENLFPWQEEFFIDNLEDVDAERAQLFARMEAFKQTREGQARFRLKELVEKYEWKSPAEHEEIERLMNQYPESLYHPKDLLWCNQWPSREMLREKARRDRDFTEKNKTARSKPAS